MNIDCTETDAPNAIIQWLLNETVIATGIGSVRLSIGALRDIDHGRVYTCLLLSTASELDLTFIVISKLMIALATATVN